MKIENLKKLFKNLFYIILPCISSTCFAASPSGTTIPPAAQIVDSNGGVWTVNGGLCYLNGTQAGNCNSVQTLLFYQGSIYVDSTFATWWEWNGSGWTQIAADPVATSIPPAAQIVDSNGGVWTVNGGLCYLNGTQAGNCNSVQTLLFYQGSIYVDSTFATWWQWNGSGWTQIAADPVATSASGTTIPPAAQIVDSNGGAWTVNGGLCYLNGVQAGNCNSVRTLLFYRNNIYVDSTFATWWQWNGSGWTQIAADPVASASGTTIPPAAQIVDSNGGVWTVNGGLCYLNGVQAGNCNSVQTLLFYQNNIYVDSTFGTWWQWNGSGWTQIAGDPRTGSPPSPQPVAVTTYHYDTLRTGWNNHETTLTATNFPSTFGILQTVMLDDQVDAQPLIVPGQTIAGGTHDVVYIATESNTIYGIDASSGAIILQRNLGSPVPAPLGCTNNGPNVGITSTPVIDLSANALYVIAYVNNPRPTYILHALNLTDLTDKPGSPITVAASHTLTNSSTFTFNAQYQRQRPALLELNGNIYAGFGSFCDFQANNSRGWLLGWGAQSLVALPANELDDTQATSPDSFFLSSIWMSGYGIAGTGTALYFSTGNSAPTTYDGTTNIQESVVTLSNQLGLLGTFTPSNVAALDEGDVDLGSGGVLLLPSQSGKFSNLAVTAGKDGRLFLLNRDAMQTPGFNSAAALDTHQLSGCWCGPSFFTGSDGISRVVTSAGSALNIWQLQQSPSPKLIQEGTATIPTSSQDPGFFTVVSSNGTNSGTGIIWAVGRPATTTSVTLYAFAATVSGGTYQLLFSSPAGSWPYTQGNANIVPVVANGKVYVASYQALTIFGIPSTPEVSAAPRIASPLPVPPVAPSSPHQITGTLLAINGSTLTIQTRTGKTVSIDGSKAAKNKQFAILGLRKPYTVQGSSFNAVGTLQAISISRAKDSSALWPSDH
jgi:hypothetical protein